MTTATLTEYDVYLWAEWTHGRSYEKLGAHLAERDGTPGVRFAVWAPNAKMVSVVGDFNDWEAGANRLRFSGRLCARPPAFPPCRCGGSSLRRHRPGSVSATGSRR